jgi:hypothetical protein
MELKLQPVMTRLHPTRDIERARKFVPMYEGRFSPLVRLFFRIGLHAYESGSVPRDPMRLQALLEQEKVTERNERLPCAADLAWGPGQADQNKTGANVRRPRLDAFHLILQVVSRSLKPKRRPEFALARSGKVR